MSISAALGNGEYSQLAQWVTDGFPTHGVWQGPTEVILDAACMFMQLRTDLRRRVLTLKAKVKELNDTLHSDSGGPPLHLARLQLAVVSMFFAKFTTELNGQEIQAYHLLESLWQSPNFKYVQSVVIGGYRVVDIIEYFFRLQRPSNLITDNTTIRLGGAPWSLRRLLERERHIEEDYRWARENLRRAWIQLQEHGNELSHSSPSSELAGLPSDLSAVDTHRIQNTARFDMQPENPRTQPSSSGSPKQTGNNDSEILRCALCNRPGHSIKACWTLHRCGTCDKFGHFEYACWWKKKHCRLCNHPGHKEADCSMSCGFCGLTTHNDAQCYKNAVCSFCKRRGHVERHCPDWKNTVRELVPEDAQSPDSRHRANGDTNGSSEGSVGVGLSTYYGVRERARMKNDRRSSF